MATLSFRRASFKQGSAPAARRTNAVRVTAMQTKTSPAFAAAAAAVLLVSLLQQPGGRIVATHGGNVPTVAWSHCWLITSWSLQHLQLITVPVKTYSASAIWLEFPAMSSATCQLLGSPQPCLGLHHTVSSIPGPYQGVQNTVCCCRNAPAVQLSCCRPAAAAVALSRTPFVNRFLALPLPAPRL